MSAVTPEERLSRGARSEAAAPRRSGGDAPDVPPDALRMMVPNAFVRWAFLLSIFSIPFTCVYLPGTGDRVGVLRLVQLLLLSAVLSQPRVCLRFVPVALLWFVVYCG